MLILQDIIFCSTFIQGAGHARRAERYVPEPGERRKVSIDVKGKVVDFPTFQCVAGVILMSLVPGHNASFMLWSCWAHVTRVTPQYSGQPREWKKLTTFVLFSDLACFFTKLRNAAVTWLLKNYVHFPQHFQMFYIYLCCLAVSRIMIWSVVGEIKCRNNSK